METISGYLADYAAATGCTSDYQISKKLGVTKQAVSLYRTGKSAPGTDTCWRIADALGLAPGTVIAAAEIERAKNANDIARLTVWRARLSSLTAHGDKIFSLVAALPAVYVAALECILCQILRAVFWRRAITLTPLRHCSKFAQVAGLFIPIRHCEGRRYAETIL